MEELLKQKDAEIKDLKYICATLKTALNMELRQNRLLQKSNISSSSDSDSDSDLSVDSFISLSTRYSSLVGSCSSSISSNKIKAKCCDDYKEKIQKEMNYAILIISWKSVMAKSKYCQISEKFKKNGKIAGFLV
jgi:hypothetical protein